ncbi:MAG TPA: hydrogenase maturation protease [Solirubrobacteraceae bacterium]|nr:hydrogenase maturation protease [Solirubrobacteraceae bacterium]
MTLVIGVGSRWRQDDGAGLQVARQLRALEVPSLEVLAREGDQAGLLEDWRDAHQVVIVDAASSGSRPGTIHRHDAAAGLLPARLSRTSTHAFGVAEAIELARALGRLPRSLLVYAIEGETFQVGEGLSASMREAVDRLVAELAVREPTCA